MIRLALVPWTGEFAPYALVFVAVVGSALLAGWRSGLLSLIIGQALVWYMVMEPRFTFGAKEGGQVGALALATLAQLAALVIIALYQREIEITWAKRESRMDLLDKALKEIDHRTSNNYQTVLALVLAQARSSKDEPVRQALQQVADRISAIASASRRLAPSSEGLQQIRLAEHLPDLCAQIERGLSRDDVAVECEFADVTMTASQATYVLVLVNELVTNALKHAFPEGRGGTIGIALHAAANEWELRIEDDGIGIKPGARTRGSGLGSRLVATFVKQLGARHEVASGADGTRHCIRIPAAA